MSNVNDSAPVVLVTGLSGAGMSTALKGLEDLGYEAIDNLPISLVKAAVDDRPETNPRPLAIGIDCRTRDFDAEKLITCKQDLSANLLLITCADFILQQRYSETRRRHPLAADRSVSDGISKEHELLSPLFDHADKVIDTTELSVHDMRRIIAGSYRTEHAYGLLTFVTSFGFRNGIPREADLVFDVRFLWNPHYDPELKPLTGQNPKIQKRLSAEDGYKTFFADLTQMLENLLPRYQEEGKSYFTIAIGCTGGRHRSVFVAEKLYEWLDSNGHSTGIKHRDLERWLIQQKERGDTIKTEKRKAV
jgi:UPF0042 nucleotide-binding protein